MVFFRFVFSRKNLVCLSFACFALFLLTHSPLLYSRLWCRSTVRPHAAKNLHHKFNSAVTSDPEEAQSVKLFSTADSRSAISSRRSGLSWALGSVSAARRVLMKCHFLANLVGHQFAKGKVWGVLQHGGDLGFEFSEFIVQDWMIEVEEEEEAIAYSFFLLLFFLLFVVLVYKGLRSRFLLRSCFLVDFVITVWKGRNLSL